MKTEFYLFKLLMKNLHANFLKTKKYIKYRKHSFFHINFGPGISIWISENYNLRKKNVQGRSIKNKFKRLKYIRRKILKNEFKNKIRQKWRTQWNFKFIFHTQLLHFFPQVGFMYRWPAFYDEKIISFSFTFIWPFSAKNCKVEL